MVNNLIEWFVQVAIRQRHFIFLYSSRLLLQKILVKTPSLRSLLNDKFRHPCSFLSLRCINLKVVI